MQPKEAPESPTTQQPEVRKPYQKPEIIYQAQLEAMAGICVDENNKNFGECQMTVLS